MMTSLEVPRALLLAALGLELGCVARPIDDDDVADDDVADDSTGASETGDSTSDVSTSDTSDATETGSDPFACVDPVPILQAGTEIPSGFVECAGGFVHRVEAVECVAPQGADDPSCADGIACDVGADCVEQPFGSCTTVDPFVGCGCHYGCATDADCNAGQVCACAGVMAAQATCIPADCTTSAECGEGLCGLSAYDGCCGTSYATGCAPPDSPCHVDADCGEVPCDGGSVPGQCTSEAGTGTWSCQAPGWCGCDCGRPFMIEGRARRAPTRAGEGWREPFTTIELDRIAAPTRRRLAAYWAEIAALEHASIASFARACVELIQLGAPAELIVDSQRAMADEVRHARVAFGLASAYAGEPIGPGPLAVDSALARRSLAQIVEGLVIEACVGETLAALEVREAASCASDPIVARLLEAIADDELRHARLGWRSLKWILEHVDESLRAVAWASFAAATRSLAPSSELDPRLPEALREHGVLDDALRDEVRRAGLAAVIEPCLAALRSQLEPLPSHDAIATG
ncbi:ferritin-like domain-containing protein [Nannocystaceae bacterium ST9]